MNKRPLCFFIILYIIIVLFIVPSEGKIPSDFLPYYDIPLKMRIKIIEPVKQKENKNEVIGQLIFLENQNKRKHIFNKKVLVNIKSEENKRNYYYGQLLDIQGSIQKPPYPRNPGAFHYRRYLLTRNIYGIVNITERQILDSYRSIRNNDLFYIVYVVRKKIEKIYEDALSEESNRIVRGMVLGDMYLIDLETKENFSSLGISHVLAISGLHITFIFIIFSTILKLIIKEEQIVLWFLIFILLFYNLLTGFSAAILRASLMAYYIVVGKLLYREFDIYTSIFLSAFCIILIQPLWIYDGGFLLSYGAVLSIVFMQATLKKSLIYLNLKEKYRSFIAVTLAAQLGTLPIVAYLFYEISIIGFIANLIIVPLTPIILFISIILIFLGLIHIKLAIYVGFILNQMIQWLLKIIDICSDFSFASFVTGLPWKIQIIGYYVFLLGVVLSLENLFLEKRKYKIYLSFIVGIVMMGSPFLFNQGLEVAYIDVGQGDSICIITPEKKVILIDGGGSLNYSKSAFDIGDKIVNPYLKYKGIRKIDYLIVTHGDEDHIQGILSVLEKTKINQILLTRPEKENKTYHKFIEKAVEKNVPIYFVKGNEEIDFQKDLKGKILHPFPTRKFTEEDQNNDRSIVFYLVYNKISFLFMGDLEEKGEELLRERYVYLKTDILKVGHHGSITSSSKKFLEKIQPKVGIISAGVNNRYKHPHEEILKRLEENKINYFRTDKQGAIIITSDGKKANITTTLKE